MSDLSREVAIITGAARGIGEGIAREFLRCNCRVVLADIDEEALDETSKDITCHDRCLPCAVDVTKIDQVELMFAKANQTFGFVSVLVNNAGIQTHAKLLELTQDLWDETININLKSVFNCSQVASRYFVKLNRGRIINIASMSAKRGSVDHTHYCAAKAGVLGFTRACALELGHYNITVNAICPGIVETRMISRTMAQKRDRWLQEIPIGRFGRPADIAYMASFLASEEADWITGQALDVNGGIVMA